MTAGWCVRQRDVEALYKSSTSGFVKLLRPVCCTDNQQTLIALCRSSILSIDDEGEYFDCKDKPAELEILS